MLNVWEVVKNGKNRLRGPNNFGPPFSYVFHTPILLSDRPNRCHWSDEPAAEEKISAGKQFHSNLDLSYPTTSRHSDISANFFQPKPIALPPKPTNFDRNGTGQCRTACPLETVKGSSSSVKQGSLVQTNGTLYSNRISTVGKLLVNESKHNSNKLFPTSSEPKSDTEIFEINTCRNRNVTDGFELLDLTDSEADEQFVTSITTESSECWVENITNYFPHDRIFVSFVLFSVQNWLNIAFCESSGII